MNLLERIFVRSWWVVLFILLCFVLFEQGMIKRDKDFALLRTHLVELQTTKSQALERQKALMLQVNSESDPAWIELILMQRLGLVPEGQTKVFFKGRD